MQIIRRFLALALFLALPVHAAEKTAARVLIVSIDGLRPDLLLRADAPRIQALAAEGAFTYYANTTDLAITLPSHASMLTGFAPEQHGVMWNDTRPEEGFVKKATLFELAKAAGLSTALVSGKSKMRTLAKPGTVDFSAVASAEKTTDAETAATAARIIAEKTPDVMVFHLPEVDTKGHAHGWGSPEQMAAIAAADQHVGAVLDALKEAGVLDQTVIFLTADHGGTGTSHGGIDPRSRLIPWIVSGPGIRKGHDLAGEKDLVVNIEDTFATAAHTLGLPIPEGVKGKVVTSAFAPAQAAETK